MELKDFEQIMNRLDKLLERCEKVKLNTKEEFEALPYWFARLRSTEAKGIISDMDKLVTTDLYHIIGMGDLTVIQQVDFNNKIRDILKYRSYMKPLAGLNIPAAPSIPDKSEYECRYLGIKLKEEFEGGTK